MKRNNPYTKNRQFMRKIKGVLLLAGCMTILHSATVQANVNYNTYNNGSFTQNKEVSGYLGRTVAEAMAAYDDLILMMDGADDVRLVGQGARFDVKLTGTRNVYDEVIYRVYVTGKDTDYTIHGLKPGVNPDDPYKDADCRLEPAGSTEYWDDKDNIVVLYYSLDPENPYIFYYDPRLM